MNLFKKSAQKVGNALNETFSTPLTQDEVRKKVLEIHNEFNTASDVALQEAERIISGQDSKIVDRGIRLSNIGFSNSTEATVSQTARAKISDSETIQKYRISHPQYKFIFDRDQFYKGTVPEKNLSEIESFVQKFGKYFEETQTGHHSYSVVEISKEAFEARENVNAFYRFVHNLSICAPLADMDVDKKSIVNGYLAYPDPVVLHRVEEGYLIVTAWGDEASDELVVNQQNN